MKSETVIVHNYNAGMSHRTNANAAVKTFYLVILISAMLISWQIG